MQQELWFTNVIPNSISNATRISNEHVDEPPNFLSIERLWVQVKIYIHDMFNPIINIIGTLYLNTSIVFIKMRFFHQILQ